MIAPSAVPLMFASRIADTVAVARVRRALRRDVLAADRDPLIDAVTDITLELDGLRTRLETEINLIRARVDRHDDAIGEAERRRASSLTAHLTEWHGVAVTPTALSRLGRIADQEKE